MPIPAQVQGVHWAGMWQHILFHKSGVSFDGDWQFPWAWIPVVCGQLVHVTISLPYVADMKDKCGRDSPAKQEIHAQGPQCDEEG